MLNKVRNTGFWFIDAISNKSSIKKALKNLELIDKMDSHDDKLVQYKNNLLNKILKHATLTTDYYKSYSKELSIEKFPIIDKGTIKNQYNSFLSNEFKKDDLITMKTSGSTGTPFTCYQNSDKKKRVYAEVIYYCGKAGYKVGRKLIYLRAVTTKNKKSKLKQWIQNETLIDCSQLNEERIQSVILNMQNSIGRDGAMLLAYPSTYQALVNSIEKVGKPVDFNIYGIVSSSELLHDKLRERLSTTFDCKCFSRYANEENGLLGQDTPEYPNTFIINEAHYYIEVLRLDSDEVAKDGEVGRIVVTDLFNYAMPMIRYDTGDVGSITYVELNGIKKRAITGFGGRKIDAVFDTEGKRVSPYAINNNFALFSKISQYQFIQESKKEYKVKIISIDEFDSENEIHDLLTRLLGDEAVIKFDYVDEISRLASGKYQYIVNKSM